MESESDYNWLQAKEPKHETETTNTLLSHLGIIEWGERG